MEDDHYTDLLVELECPICTNYLSPPIRQCATGHSICADCRRKLPRCAMCQGPFTDSRNITLEGLAVKMRYPCLYKDSGCNLKLAYNERETHEAKCPCRGYKCEMEKCSWVGRLEDLSAHWASKKMTSKPYRATNLCHTKMRTESYYVNIIEAFDKLFWFKCRLVNKRLQWAVQYIGKSHEAENFCYEIEVFKPKRPKQKILLSNYCQPVDMSNSVLFGGVCISIPCDVIEQFLGDDQTLVYYMRVHTVKGGTPEEAAASVNIPERKQRDRSKGPPQNHFKNKPKKHFGKPNAKKTADGFVVL